MGRSTPQTHAKRQREQAKKEKKRNKQEERIARNAAKRAANKDSGDVRSGADPEEASSDENPALH